MAQPPADLVKELRRLAAATKEEQAKSDALFSSIGEGAIATDSQGKVVRANQAALDILGYSRRELLGKWFPAKVIAVREDGSVVDGFNRPIARVFITGEAVSERNYYKRKDGTIIPVAITVSPIILKGKPVGAIEIFRNISIETAGERMKTDFISIASHQLRTPLSAINTYSHMLAEGYAGNINKNQARFIQTIITATDKMNELISTLLNITRLEGGNIAVESRQVDLRDILKKVVAELAPQIKKKRLSITNRATKNLPEAFTDPLIVGEVLTNLLSNAIKYTPEGGTVSIHLTIEKGNFIFRIKDNGFGIPVSEQAQIFTKFFRAKNVVKRDVSGTGLGLYLIKILADRINGDVSFQSRENKGTTFYFSLSQKGSAPQKGKFKLESSRAQK